MEQIPKIVKRRLQEPPTPGVHLDPDLLTAFAEKSLNDRERSQVLRHLAACADCRDVLSLSMPEIEPAPAPVAKRSSLVSWPVLRWGALAACIVVVSAAVTLRYQNRRAAEPVASEKAPAAPALNAESEVSRPPSQALVAKNAPLAPLPSERDFGAAGKLSRQRDKNADQEMTDMRTAVSTAPGAALGQGSGAGRGATADAAKSADAFPKPAVPLVAAVPPSSPAAKTIEANPPGETRNDGAGPAPRASAETVTIENAAPVVALVPQTAERKTKDELQKAELQKKAGGQALEEARAGSSGATAQGNRNADALSAEAAPAPSRESAARSRAGSAAASRWTLSADGALQRSFDSGRTWSAVPVASHIVFRALAANDSDVWVGGTGGSLYHSSDAGQHWIQVKPLAGGKPLTADILAVEFSNPRHGKLITSTGETWTTSDAGSSWQIR
jgi:hypothetical protein